MAAPIQPAEAPAPADILPAGLRIEVSEQGTTTTLEFEGEWCLAQREVTRAKLDEVLERGPECIVLDLSRVSFIDSSGIHVVVSAAKVCAERSAHIVIIPGPPQVHRVFEICKLTNVLRFAAQPESAAPGSPGASWAGRDGDSRELTQG